MAYRAPIGVNDIEARYKTFHATFLAAGGQLSLARFVASDTSANQRDANGSPAPS